MIWIDKGLDCVALLYALLMFPAPIFWLAVHPAVRFWRRFGNRAFWIALPIWVICGALLLSLRTRIFGERFHRDSWTWIIGAMTLFAALWLDGRTRREFGIRRLVGIPELNPFDPRARVVSEGVYSHLRHPRYLQYMLTFWALALLTGAKGVFLLAILTVLLYLIVAPLEERELREQYGQSYEAYSAQVPRFLPRLRRRTRPQVSS
jgi:protein-S-isoprenylcysteine O-methyltransferase Ste14